MSISILTKFKSIKKDKLSDTAKGVLEKMAEATNNFKDYAATKALRAKFEAFYEKLKESKPEAIKGYKAPKPAELPKPAAASKPAKKKADPFKEALKRRKNQGGVPKNITDVEKDADRPAINIKGKRTSKNGNIYYEYRENRYDKRPKKYPKLEDGGIMAKGGIVVTSIKDIPNFQQRLDEGKITYRGLGMGKLSDDFYDLAGTHGVRIKVDKKEYYITDKEFDTFSRDANGKVRIRFDAPYKKSYADGGTMAKGGEMDYQYMGEPHKLDEFENGGEIAEQNTEMLMSLNHQIEHHAKEIGEILTDKTPVMAWVLAKAERAASDLSDIAHYLDGEKQAHEE